VIAGFASPSAAKMRFCLICKLVYANIHRHEHTYMCIYVFTVAGFSLVFKIYVKIKLMSIFVAKVLSTCLYAKINSCAV